MHIGPHPRQSWLERLEPPLHLLMGTRERVYGSPRGIFHIACAAPPGEVFPYPKGGTFLSLTRSGHFCVWQCVLLHWHWLIATLPFLFARDKISLAEMMLGGMNIYSPPINGDFPFCKLLVYQRVWVKSQHPSCCGCTHHGWYKMVPQFVTQVGLWEL